MQLTSPRYDTDHASMCGRTCVLLATRTRLCSRQKLLTGTSDEHFRDGDESVEKREFKFELTFIKGRYSASETQKFYLDPQRRLRLPEIGFQVRLNL